VADPGHIRVIAVTGAADRDIAAIHRVKAAQYPRLVYAIPPRDFLGHPEI
jgi:hypothetical protein